MSIKEFELMHGAVLVKICRNEKPLALTLIESDNSRSAYRLNDEVILYIKHSANPSERQNGVTVWQFTFSPKHIADIKKFVETKSTFLALVCVQENLNEEREVGLLFPDEIMRCLDLDKRSTQSIFVRMKAGQSLRVTGNDVELVVPRNRLETWDVPGR